MSEKKVSICVSNIECVTIVWDFLGISMIKLYVNLAQLKYTLPIESIRYLALAQQLCSFSKAGCRLLAARAVREVTYDCQSVETRV